MFSSLEASFSRQVVNQCKNTNWSLRFGNEPLACQVIIADYYCSELWSQDETKTSTHSKVKVIRVGNLCQSGENADPGELLCRLPNFKVGIITASNV